jgi:hypothetical protein
MSNVKSALPRNLPDCSIRDSLLHPANLRAFLRECVPALADGFDCDRARLLNREFPLDDWRRRASDLPFEIPFRLGPEEVYALVFLLLEHQSAPDPMMPLRLLYLVTIYWDQQWRKYEQLALPRPPFQLHPVLPIVLYTGLTPWQGTQKLRDLLGEPRLLHGFAPDWEPLYWSLEQRTPRTLLDSGDEWLQALAVVRARGAAPAEFATVYAEVLRRLEALRSCEHVRWYDLLRLVLGWALHTRPKTERDQLVSLAQASQARAESQQEVQTMAETIAEALIEEGIEKGMEEGMEKGGLRACREALRRALMRKFGALSPALLNHIEVTTDLERLLHAIEQVSVIDTLDQLPL